MLGPRMDDVMDKVVEIQNQIETYNMLHFAKRKISIFTFSMYEYKICN